MIRIEHLTKRFGPTTVLDDISMEMAPGRITGLVGPNGSGKTMLMRMIVGLVRPTSGEVEVMGGVGGRASIGILLEGPAFLDGCSGLRNLELLASIRGVADARDVRTAMAAMGLDPDDARKYRKYSLGMKQRLGVAAAVMEHPEILVLDEPTNALDASGVQLVTRQVFQARDRGATVLLASHDAGFMQNVCDEVWTLAEGHLDGHEVLRPAQAHGGGESHGDEPER